MPEATQKMAEYELMAWAQEETGLRATDVLREYASALRGDWGSIDGRSEKIALNRLADAVEYYGTATLKQIDLVGLRLAAGVTPSGSGEWYDFSGKNHEEDHVYETFVAAKKVYTAHGGKGMAWW
jgi:hypothetical protein